MEAVCQHPNVSNAMNKLCKLLAQCNLDGEEPDLYAVFVEKMAVAHSNQQKRGSKARWILIDYTDGDAIVTDTEE